MEAEKIKIAQAEREEKDIQRKHEVELLRTKMEFELEKRAEKDEKPQEKTLAQCMAQASAIPVFRETSL